jgi:hypothetical protein
VKKEGKPEGKKEDHKVSSIGMSPLKRQVPSHIEGFGNILIGYAERVMQKRVEVFHKWQPLKYGWAATVYQFSACQRT